MDFLGLTQRNAESERSCERLRANEIGFIELQPRDICDPDDRIARAPGVVTAERPLLAV
jgi:hypothetical protein